MEEVQIENSGIAGSIFEEIEESFLNAFFIKADRHDRDRVEFQFGFDGIVNAKSSDFTYNVDFILFVPKTLGLTEVESASQLRNEFQSYVRLHTHLNNPNSNFNLAIVRDHLLKLKKDPKKDELKRFAIDLDGFIKFQGRKIRKAIYALKEKPPVNPSHVDAIISDIHQIKDLLSEFRYFVKDRGLEGKHASQTPTTSFDHDLLSLNEYISHIYVQKLIEVRIAAKNLPEDARKIEKRLKELSINEAHIRHTYHLHVENSLDEDTEWEDENLYLRRIGLLKKFFQKSLFVKISGQSSEKRLLIPVYALAAAVAAGFAIMVQLYQVRTMTERVGINSVAIISVGIVAYVIKDIMKDFLRKYLLKSGSKIVADYEKKLFIDRDKEQHNIGMIREFINTFDADRLPQDLKNIRYSVPGGELEASLNEDILHFKKQVRLNVQELSDDKETFPWGLREIVRYRFDRFLISMEDAYKKMHLLTEEGDYRTRYGHRVYHIHAATWIQMDSPIEGKKIPPVFRAFTITLDKTGVISCKARDDVSNNIRVPNLPL